jgi:hypothetical protein
MSTINCGKVHAFYNEALSKIDKGDKGHVSIKNSGIGFAERTIIDTPNARDMIDGLSATKPLGLEIEIAENVCSYSTPSSSAWNNFGNSIENLGGIRLNGGIGWASFGFETEGQAHEALSELQETAPTWINLKIGSNGKTIIMQNETPVLNVTLSVDPKCQ